jgi:two-component system cell cycle sensor histidine kinase/response regulator CckA
MSDSPNERLAWVGPDTPEARAAMAALEAASEGAIVAAAESVAAATHILARQRSVVVLDATAGCDWGRSAAALDWSAAHATRIAWGSDADDPELDRALEAGFDAVHAGASVPWPRTLRRAHARAAARRRLGAEGDYHVFFDTAVTGMGVLDPVSRTTQFNPAAQRILGIDGPILAFEDILAMSHPDDADRDASLLRELLSGKRDHYRLEKRYVRPDGETIWVHLAVVARRNGDGEPRVVFSTLEDVSARRRAEEALRASEASIRELYRTSGKPELDGGDKVRQLLDLGRQRFGLPTGFLSRLDEGMLEMLEVRSPDPALKAGLIFPLESSYCLGVVRDLAPVAIEDAAVEKWRDHPAHAQGGVGAYLGTPVMVDDRVYGTLCFCGPDARPAPYTDADKDFLQLMAQWIAGEVGRSNAEVALRASQEQLLQAQKMEAMGRLAGGVAHDFNNLLMGIKGNVELLLQRSDLDDAVLEDLFEINHAAVRSQRLIQQLLAFSRKQVLQPQVLELNVLVADMGRMLERLLGQDVRLVYDLDPELGRVRADQGQIEQVILNLAVNARDAMPEGGVLSIRTANSRIGDWAQKYPRLPAGTPAVLLSVSDTGVGMDEEVQRRVFEPFFTTKDPDRGTGLGLATVYGIVKQSGGYIWLDSEPGEGSIFEIYLPIVEQPASAPVPVMAPVELATARSGGSETVLLVEDEQMIRKITRRMLQHSGYQVLEAANGVEALELCRSYDQPIHLLLTDIVMPQMGGRDLARLVAAARPEMKIIFMSGYTGDESLELGMFEDEPAFLQKPVDLETLARGVRTLLDRPAARVRWARRNGSEQDWPQAADTLT